MPAARVDELAQRFDLDLTRRIGSLSKGNRQKVGLVQAFMHRPPLLVLDEPTSGLDPFLQQQFIELVRDASMNGQTVFMSSHVLSEVQATCHRVGIIREGRLVTVANVDELREQAQRRIEITFAGPVAATEFEALPELRNVTVAAGPGGTVLRALLAGSPDGLVKTAARHEVVGLLAEEPELEELFFTFYEPGEPAMSIFVQIPAGQPARLRRLGGRDHGGGRDVLGLLARLRSQRRPDQRHRRVSPVDEGRVPHDRLLDAGRLLRLHCIRAAGARSSSRSSRSRPASARSPAMRRPARSSWSWPTRSPGRGSRSRGTRRLSRRWPAPVSCCSW